MKLGPESSARARCARRAAAFELRVKTLLLTPSSTALAGTFPSRGPTRHCSSCSNSRISEARLSGWKGGLSARFTTRLRGRASSFE